MQAAPPSPAVASALALLQTVWAIFLELCLDLATLAAGVCLLAFPWEWRSCWARIRAATGQQHRRCVARRVHTACRKA